MKPVVFTIPYLDRDIPGYGLMLMIAFLVSIWWATRRAEKSGANPDVILNCGFIALIAGVVGCRAMYVFHYWDEQFAAYETTGALLWAIVDVTKGGLEFYGGFILATLTTLAWLKFHEKVSLRWYMDIIAPSAALGLAIGRIGCFLNGCCWGGVCELPWGVTFPAGSNAAVTQWVNKAPGAEMPEALIVEFQGKRQPLTHEAFRATDEQIDRAMTAILPVLDLQAKLDGVEDAQERARLESELKAAKERVVRTTPGVGGCGRSMEGAALMALSMRRNDMTAAEIRAIAAAHHSLPVHPTQLYSTITALLIAGLLDLLYWRRTRDGQVILTLLLVEPVTRWMIEVIRADNPVDTLGVFTISQGLAVAMTVIGAVGLLTLRAARPRSPDARRWEPPAEPSGA